MKTLPLLLLIFLAGNSFCQNINLSTSDSIDYSTSITSDGITDDITISDNLSESIATYTTVFDQFDYKYDSIIRLRTPITLQDLIEYKTECYNDSTDGSFEYRIITDSIGAYKLTGSMVIIHKEPTLPDFINWFQQKQFKDFRK